MSKYFKGMEEWYLLFNFTVAVNGPWPLSATFLSGPFVHNYYDSGPPLQEIKNEKQVCSDFVLKGIYAGKLIATRL